MTSIMTPRSEGADRPSQSRPETFRLPRPGTGDPYFGITRGAYYQGEIDGWWTLIRLKRPGMKRGITLVPFAEVEAFISKQRKHQNGGAQPAVAQKEASSGAALRPQLWKQQEERRPPTLGTL
jgi:hypothetical protein